MSRLENIPIRIKYSKIKKIETICSYFCEDYTAIEVAKKLNLSRQTINHYYKILRKKILDECLLSDAYLLEKLLTQNQIHIKYLNIYQEDIFYIEYEGSVLILEKSIQKRAFNHFIQQHVKEPLSKHKKANCVRVLFNEHTNAYLISGYLTQEDTFSSFLQERLKQFRGINKEKLYDYIKESQIRFNLSKNILNQKLIESFL